MQQLRLIGLTLFITAIFLAMAAAITKTTHIRVQTRGATTTSTPPANIVDAGVLPPREPGIGDGNSQPDSSKVEFTSIPIVGPLIVAGGTGLLLWFLLSNDNPRTFSSSKPRRGRRRN